MTPAIKLLEKQKIDFELREYCSEDESAGYGMQAVEALNQDPARVLKTLLAVIDGNDRKPNVAIIPVADQLDLKKFANHCAGRKAAMADPLIAQRVTGYIVGGISPIAQKQSLKACIDESALGFETVFVSGGKRGLQLELNPVDLIKVISASVASICK